MSFQIIPKNSIKIPFYSSFVSCGLFGIADDFTENYLSLDEKYLSNKESTFFVRADGDSMEPDIKPRDILIVDRSVKVFSGCVGTFYFNGNAICKQYIQGPSGIILRSFNTKYKDIHIKETDDLTLFGVVIGITRDLC